MIRREVLSVLGGGFLLGLMPSIGFAQTAAQQLPAADAVVFESLAQVQAIAEKGPAIVYFHADWCPTCKATMISFEARWAEVQPGITLILADFDKDLDLRNTFGVTYQNTYVQVNADGSQEQIWNGGGIKALNERPIFKV